MDSPRLNGTSFEVVVRIDMAKGTFIESVHDDRDDAQARVKYLLHPNTLIEVNNLTRSF
ncbi:MAG TPA: hypothetical protein VII92_07480 [Anaerolineae bacterium]